MMLNKIDDEWINLFFIEAEKWSNLVYAHKRILELLHLERYKKVNGINQLLSDCQDIFEHMEMEQYTISEIIAWGATISISHRKIWSENPIECVKLLLTSIFLGSINTVKTDEEGLKEQLLIHIQEGLLGNIEVIDITKMKQECMQYYEISYKNHKKYREKNKDTNSEYYKEEASNFEKVRKLIEKLDCIPKKSKVIRFNKLGNQISQVYDAEYKKVIQKTTQQEMASYIFVVRDEVYVVDVDDPW